MPINLQSLSVSGAPKALFDIVKFEGAQNALPASNAFLGGSVAAYAIAKGVLHGLEHSLTSALIFGVFAAALLSGVTYVILRLYKSSDKLVQTLAALAATGAIAALASIVLHFLFAVALPPPLPTNKLVNFLLFPIAIWIVFMFTFLFRHAKLRTLPAFALAATYVIVTDFIVATLLR
jgi:hypothetical protein